MSKALAEAASFGLEMVETMEQDKSMCALLDRAKGGLILLKGTKAGFGVGGRLGSGFVLAKVPPAGPHEPERWSAPLFVRVRVGQLGLCFGYATLKTWLVAMSRKILEQLETTGSHSLVGLDQTFTVAHDREDVKTDVIALSSGSSEVLGASIIGGVMMDFSFAGGSMQVDTGKIRELYGAQATAASVLSGEVPAPAELEPVYARLNAIIKSGHRVSTQMMRTSLERLSGGYDPDRRVASSASAPGKGVHTGDAERVGDGLEIRATT